MKKIIMTTIVAGLVLGCSQKEETKSEIQAVETEKIELISADSFGHIEAEETLIVTQARNKNAGDSIIVKGKIMGAISPFVESRAMFIIGDPETITSCELMGADDHCKTPWDTCCEPKEKLAAGTISVQLVDEYGKVIKQGLQGQYGLDNLKHVVIQGKVSELSNADTMTIVAEKIMVK